MPQSITQDRLKELLDYDAETGIFTWKSSRSGTNGAGSEAGAVDSKGYRQIAINGVLSLAHRLVFLYIDGYMPENSVDHINRNKLDNRRVNLREVSKQCQMRNRDVRRDNSSSVTGVVWHKRSSSWRARIGVNGKHRNLGHFTDLLEAAYHRYAGEQCLGFPDCDINPVLRNT